MKPTPKLFTFLCGSTLLSVVTAIPIAAAAVTNWSGAGTDDNWSTSDNWSDGLPAGNDVVFAAADATGTPGPSGTVNNIVDANTTVTTLKYINLDASGYHTTLIPSGVTLTVNGTGANIEVQSPTNGADDVVYATILGDGTLSANNTAATLYVGQGVLPTNTAGSSTRRATLDMSGLGEFSATLSRIIVGRQNPSSQPNRPQGTLKLARNNTLVLSGTPGILLGDIVSGNGTGQAQVLELGTTNAIRSNTGITIGGRKGNGFLRFNNAAVALGAGSAIFRDNTGTGRQANWLIGDNSTQDGGGTAATGAVDFSLYGAVDALVGNVVLGHATAGTASTVSYTQGTLTFDAGVIDTNSLSAGIQPTTATKPGNARGTVNVNGTAKLRVNGNVTLGRDIGEATYNAQGLINIGGGEVVVSGDVICGTGSGNKITLADGSLTLGGSLGDDSAAGNVPLETFQVNGGTLKFNFGSTPNPFGSRAKVTNLNVPNPVNLTFSGSNLSPGPIELIKYTNFDQANQFDNLNLVLPDRIDATLVNNTANNSIDLDIKDVFSNSWSGAFNGDWNINTTANWKLTPGNIPATYLQSAVPGEPVIFDDSATGTKSVNLTTTLSPAGVTVDTELTYTFSGAGALSGPGGLTKRGSGELVIGNSGTNDFTGGINIEAGKLRIAGGNDRLPVNAAVTLADEATAELDLNNLNQSLLSLNGGGTSGGSVNLGSGTLAITGASNFSGVVSGSGSVNKSGTGTLTLSGANSYSGGTNFEGNGVLALAHSSAAGSGPIHFATTQTGTAGTFTLNGGIDVTNTIQLDAVTGRNTINSLGTLSNTLSGNITINNNSGNLVVFQNSAPAGSGTTYMIGGPTPNSTTITAATYASSISFRATNAGELGILNSRIDAPNANFNINNNGFWTVNSTGNAWAVTSLTTNGSRIKLGADNALATGARVDMTAGSTIDLNGFNQTVAGLGGSGTGARVRNDSASASSILTIAGLTADRNFVGGIVDGDNGRKISLVMNDSSSFSQTLTGASTYSGDTTVTSGTLILAAANPGNESSTVTIAATGATLALNFDGTDTVGKLFIGDTQMANGIYGAVGSEAPVIGIPQITGTGTLAVSGASSAGFAAWQDANGATGGLDDDHDNDGVANGIEYFLGGPDGNTTGFTPLPGMDNNAGTLSVTWTKGPGYTGTYGTHFWIETSATLDAPSWTTETEGVNVTTNGNDVTFTFPNPLDTRKFARLKVTGP